MLGMLFGDAAVDDGFFAQKENQAAIIGAVAGLVGAAIGAFAAWKAANSTNRFQAQIAAENLAFQKQLANDQRRAAVEAMILKLSEFAMEYPTLEKDAYCATYPNCPGDPNGKERYENYCTYVFNAIRAVWEFAGRDPEKVKEILHVEEPIQRHWRYWHNDEGNLGYDDPFRAYIHSVIDDLKRRGKIQ